MDIFQQDREFEASDNVETELYNGFLVMPIKQYGDFTHFGARKSR